MQAPAGFRNVRVHDLRHAFGQRLRAAGVSLEDRRDLLGHKAPDITTHYSAAEIGRLVAATNRIAGSHETPTPTLLQVFGTRVYVIEWKGRDSNPRPRHYEFRPIPGGDDCLLSGLLDLTLLAHAGGNSD
jgi:hypothetical protein